MFDGVILHRNKPDYQLIDITDPVILPFIYDPMGLHDTCDVSDDAALRCSHPAPQRMVPPLVV